MKSEDAIMDILAAVKEGRLETRRSRRSDSSMMEVSRTPTLIADPQRLCQEQLAEAGTACLGFFSRAVCLDPADSAYYAGSNSHD